MTGIYSEFWIFEVKNLLIEKGSILAECDKIPKMGKIICFYGNTHVLKSEPAYFVTFSHRYCTHTYKAEWWPITMLRVIWNPLALCIVSLFCFGNSEALLWQVNVLSFDIDMEERKEKRELISGQQKRFFSSILSEFPVLRCLISRVFFAFQYRTGTEWAEEAGEGPTVLQIWKNIAKRNWWISAREGQ